MKIKKYIKKQMKKLETCITYEVLQALQQRESNMRVFGDSNKKSLSKYDPMEVDDHGGPHEFSAKKQNFSQFIYEYQTSYHDNGSSADAYYDVQFLKNCTGKSIKSIIKCNADEEDTRYSIVLSDATMLDCDINCIKMI